MNSMPQDGRFQALNTTRSTTTTAPQPGVRSTFVTQVEQNDVLMGRGAPIVDNPGNIRFRELIRSRLADYQAATARKEKDQIARQIAATVRGRTGLFLRKIESPEEAQQLGVPLDIGLAWTCVEESAVLVKVKQALRDQGLEAEQEEKKAQAKEGVSGPSPRKGRKRPKVATSTTRTSSSPAAAGGEQEGANDSGSAGGNDGKISATANKSGSGGATMPEALSRQASDNVQQQQQPAPAPTPSPALSGSGGGMESNAQHALFMNQLEQQRLLQQQLQLQQQQQLQLQQQQQQQQMGLLGPGTGSLPFGGGGPGNVGMRVAATPGDMMNINLMAPGAGNTMMNQHLASLRPGPSSMLNTAAPSSMPQSPFASMARSPQDSFRASPPGRASMGLGLPHGDGTGTSLAQATSMYLGRPAGDMLGPSAASLPTGRIDSSIGGMRGGAEKESSTTSIEATLQNATKLCQQLHAISPTGPTGRKQFPSQFLQLTQIELCILMVLVNSGLPLWNSTLKNAPQAGGMDSNAAWSATYALTWVDVANQVSKEASARQADSKKLFNQNPDMPLPPPPLHGGDDKSDSGAVSAAASHFCKNPKDLAQAAVMLLEKIRQRADSLSTAIVGAASTSGNKMMSDPSQDSMGAGGLSSKLQTEGLSPFLEAELSRWGTTLDVSDSVGKPVPYSNSDFINSYPLALRHEIVNIVAVLDAASCRTLFNQVANLSRLRHTFQKVPKDQLLVSLGQALDPSMSSLPQTAFLDRLPGTSQEERTHLDYSLLRSILEQGFLGLFGKPLTENLLFLAFRRAGLTKPAMERRAAVLIQALHAHVDSRKRKQVIEEHNNKVAGLIAVAMASSGPAIGAAPAAS